MRLNYIVVEGHIKGLTSKAVLVETDDTDVWIPRTCLAWESDEAVKNGEIHIDLKVVDWWAKKNGLA